jgi:hypothetical protein
MTEPGQRPGLTAAWLLRPCRYLMPYLVPYGGISWTVSCLLPPSSISLFATVLLKMEVRAPRWFGFECRSCVYPVTFRCDGRHRCITALLS